MKYQLGGSIATQDDNTDYRIGGHWDCSKANYSIPRPTHFNRVACRHVTQSKSSICMYTVATLKHINKMPTPPHVYTIINIKNKVLEKTPQIHTHCIESQKGQNNNLG